MIDKYGPVNNRLLEIKTKKDNTRIERIVITLYVKSYLYFDDIYWKYLEKKSSSFLFELSD